jgi:hypothetical protein
VAWLDAGRPDSDIVVSSRIRVARNIEGFPLKAKLKGDQEAALESVVVEGIERARLAPDLSYDALKDKDSVHRRLLFERHLISMEHLKAEGHHGVAYTPLGDVSVMVNEERPPAYPGPRRRAAARVSLAEDRLPRRPAGGAPRLLVSTLSSVSSLRARPTSVPACASP